MKCPNCKSTIKEDELIATILTNSLLCCPKCEGKSKHFAVAGNDPGLVYGEAQAKEYKRKSRKD